jgi:uncharacterized membrane protein YbaN (DUF454 family)
MDAETTLDRPLIRSPRRLALAGLGLIATALGAIGIVIPGLPTTVFLIAASYCFTRSCPWIERKLLQNRFFAPYMRVVAGQVPVSRRARLSSALTMWGFVLLSGTMLHLGGRLTPIVAALLLTAAVVATFSIARYRRW